jgi:hypothetical protein
MKNKFNPRIACDLSSSVLAEAIVADCLQGEALVLITIVPEL